MGGPSFGAVLALILSLVPVVQCFELHGDAECPCIDPVPSFNNFPPPEYSSSYGARGCRAYDLAVDPTCVSNATSVVPSWCYDRWCYVSKANCSRPHSPSRMAVNASLAAAFLPDACPSGDRDLMCSDVCDRKLYYSYETCGNLDAFTVGIKQAEFLRSFPRTLRVGMPGDEAYHLVSIDPTDGLGIGDSGRDGAVVRLVAKMHEAYGVAWRSVPISDDARALSPLSSYTACVIDIALNRTDLCFGPFWTPEFRRKLVTFSGNIFNTDLTLVVPQVANTEVTFHDMISRPFTPFSNEVWMWLVLTLVYVGVVRWAIEPAGEADDIQHNLEGLSARNVFGENQAGNAEVLLNALTDMAFKTVNKGARPKGRAQKEAADSKERSRSAQMRLAGWKALSAFSFHQGVALQGCLGDWRGEDPKNLSQWILLIGASFSMLLIITFYTAQVTQSLIFASRIVCRPHVFASPCASC